jgi:hypothetical protein
MVAISMVFLFHVDARSQERFYDLVIDLKQNDDDPGWKRLEMPLTDLKNAVEELTEHNAYKSPGEIVSIAKTLALPNAAPGIHSSWYQFRIVSTGSVSGSIYNAAAVVRGDLAGDENSKENRQKPKERRRSLEGTIKSSIVIVDGTINLYGYISDSIVISSGPIKIDGYISNSMVISCYTGDAFSVDLSHGYVDHAIVVAKKCRPGSARDCVIYGDVDGTDFRGADIRSWQSIEERIDALGMPVREFPDKSKEREKEKPKAKEPAVAERFASLLATEDQLEAAKLAESLSDAILTAEQVKSLIEHASSTTSDVRRIMLWNAIRLSRDIQGRKFLRETLARKATSEQKVQFVQSLRNLNLDDAPVLIELYATASDEILREGQSLDESNDVREQVVRFACIDWTLLVTDRKIDPGLDYEGQVLEQENYNKRRERALEGQSALLVWLLKNGVEDEHRLDAFAAAQRVSAWPNNGKWFGGVSLQDALLESSSNSKFRARVVEKYGVSMPLLDFLAPERGEEVEVRLATIRSLRKLILMEQRSAVGYSFQYDQMLRHVAQSDKSEEVREAAAQLLRELPSRDR